MKLKIYIRITIIFMHYFEKNNIINKITFTIIKSTNSLLKYFVRAKSLKIFKEIFRSIIYRFYSTF